MTGWSDKMEKVMGRLAAGVRHLIINQIPKYADGQFYDEDGESVEVHGRVIDVTYDLLVEVLFYEPGHPLRPQDWHPKDDRALIPLDDYLNGDVR